MDYKLDFIRNIDISGSGVSSKMQQYSTNKQFNGAVKMNSGLVKFFKSRGSENWSVNNNEHFCRIKKEVLVPFPKY